MEGREEVAAGCSEEDCVWFIGERVCVWECGG